MDYHDYQGFEIYPLHGPVGVRWLSICIALQPLIVQLL
jgi:hypothetical protein